MKNKIALGFILAVFVPLVTAVFLERFNSNEGQNLALEILVGTSLERVRLLRVDTPKHGAKGAEHAAIARVGAQQHTTAFALVEELACVRRHRLRFSMTARGTGDDRDEAHLVAPQEL